jgi:hypothetical protein
MEQRRMRIFKTSTLLEVRRIEKKKKEKKEKKKLSAAVPFLGTSQFWSIKLPNPFFFCQRQRNSERQWQTQVPMVRLQELRPRLW